MIHKSAESAKYEKKNYAELIPRLQRFNIYTIFVPCGVAPGYYISRLWRSVQRAATGVVHRPGFPRRYSIELRNAIDNLVGLCSRPKS